MGPLWWDLGGCEVLILGQLDIFTFKVGYPPSKLKDSKQYIFIHISASRCPIDIFFVSKDTSIWSLHIIGHFLELDIRRPSWNPRWRPRKLIFFLKAFRKFCPWPTSECLILMKFCMFNDSYLYWLCGKLQLHANRGFWFTGVCTESGVK